jgi:hypothetical protein
LRIAAVRMPMQTNIRLTRQRRDRATSRGENPDPVSMLNCALPLNGQRVTVFVCPKKHAISPRGRYGYSLT